MIRILIVDDHILIREGLKKILLATDDIEIVGELGEGEEVIGFLKDTYCDLVILDVNLPDINGLDVLKKIKAAESGIRVLMLSIFPEEHFAVRAIRAGAMGYLTKDSAPGELIGAIRKIMSGNRYITETLAESLAEVVDSNLDDDTHKILSDREFQVLLAIGRGLSLREISDELELSQSTVHTYKNRILKKLKLDSAAHLIRYVISHNLSDQN